MISGTHKLRGTVSEDRETRALRLIACTFFALAAYLAIESITDLVSQHRPEQSTAGIAVTAAALVVMPLLALAKRRTGQSLGNQALIADAAESAFCAFTSAATLPASGSMLGWDGGGPTLQQLLLSRAWQSKKASKHGRPTATETTFHGGRAATRAAATATVYRPAPPRKDQR